MDLAMKPLNIEVSEEEIHKEFFSYIMGLGLTEIQVPPPDILYKIGNQNFFDNGEIKKDFERASSYRSGFKYQYFLAGPLSPREVWLPDKFTKNVNLFWMKIGRQLLKKDDTYPCADPFELYERIRDRLDQVTRFDLSGFGFQFPRQLLSIMGNVIEEIYPCGPIMEQNGFLQTILNDVRVEKGFEVVRPPRGIGLGYFEDLKTLCMLAILKKYQPVSLYGDQGLLDIFNLGGISELTRYGFLVDWEKVEFSSSVYSKIKWAGHSMSKHSMMVFDRTANKVIGALFQPEHWMRKQSLQSLYEEHGVFYKNSYKRIRNSYRLIFGPEFKNDELEGNFLEGGINPFASVSLGSNPFHRLYWSKVPYSDRFFEIPYYTPFHRREPKVWPVKVQKDFSKKRQALVKRRPVDSSLLFYGEPRVQLNNVFRPPAGLIPQWADLLYIFNYGSTTGAFTYGYEPDELERITSLYPFLPDPLRTAASGGYTYLDLYYNHNTPQCKEELDAARFLSTLSHRVIPSMQRADLNPSLWWADDVLYRNTDLTQYSRPTPLKRKLVVDDSESNELDESIRRALVESALSTTLEEGPSSFQEVFHSLYEVPEDIVVDENVFDEDDLYIGDQYIEEYEEEL